MLGPFRVEVEAVGSEKIPGGAAEEDAEAVSARRSNPLPFWSLGLEAFFDKPDQTFASDQCHVASNYHNGCNTHAQDNQKIMAMVTILT